MAYMTGLYLMHNPGRVDTNNFANIPSIKDQTTAFRLLKFHYAVQIGVKRSSFLID